MKRRLIALLLCFAMVLPILPANAAEEEFAVYHDGSSVSSVVLPQYDKVELTAEGEQTSGYQWQIHVSGDMWVDISGADSATLNLSYAMVASLLDDGAAKVRCKATQSGSTVVTDEVTVSVAYDEPVAESVTEEPVVVQEAVVIEGPVISEPETSEEVIVEDEVVEEDNSQADAEAAIAEAEAELTKASDEWDAAEAALKEAEAKAAEAETAAVEAENASTAADEAAALAAEAAEAEGATEEQIAAAETAAADAQTAAETAATARAAADEAAAAVIAAQERVAAAEAAYYAADEALTNVMLESGAMSGVASFDLTSEADAGLDTADDGSDYVPPESYDIVIQYLFAKDGSTAAQPYTATVTEGSDFYAVVQNPVITGYLPYEGEAAETTETVTLNYTNITEDKTVTVYYKSDTVDYTVEYYLQNVNGEGYTKDESLTKTLSGLTDAVVDSSKIEIEIDGFTRQWYDSPTIAADGSTKVEVYYERNFYLMLFELDGGYGVEPIYARYGSPISVGTATKAGYTHTGWTLNGAEASIPATMPAENRTYTAVWTADATAKVTVVFWGENPNDEEYSYITTGTLERAPGTVYTYQDGDDVFLICGKEEHAHTATCTLNCGKTEHTTHTDTCLGCVHVCTTECYEIASLNGSLQQTTQPSQLSTPTKNGIYTYTTNSLVWIETHYYLYLNGEWYCAYSWGDKDDTTEITSACNHVHTTDCYICEVHQHTAACYSCGKEAHTHASSCNQTGSGLDSTLWTFVRSETATVAADGSTVINVYYDRTTFTMTFMDEEGDSTLSTITDKWGADIRTRFETVSKSNTFFWSAKPGGGSPWTSFMDVMPQENRTYYADPQSGSTNVTAKYFGETLTEGTYENLYTVSFRGSSSITVTVEEFVEIEGFTFNESKSSDVGDYYNGSEFYYDRNSYAIEFYSPNSLLKKVENVLYEAPLSSYDWTPEISQAPAQYEPGSVVFDGWYLNPECTGSEYTFADHTMPAAPNDGDTSLTLYAKWVPVTHTVTVYKTDELTEKIGDTITVSHGEFVPEASIPATPVNGDLEFVGWFYMDGETEKAFDFANMPVNKDLVIYAKWSDDTVVNYTIYYVALDENGDVVKNEDGTEKQIADPTTGTSLTNLSRTFEAKSSESLYEGYTEGYFPEVKSHTITFTTGTNEFTFYYKPVAAVPYTVKYLEEGTDAVLHEEKVVSDNRKAVVTETFVVIPGYMPDAYQKRLVVSADGTDNVLIFYYHKDDTHAYYMMSHHTQNLDGETYTEVGSTQAVGDVGTTYSAQPNTIPGFTYVESKTELVVGESTTLGTSHILTTEGLEIKHYYDRNSYSYTVQYLEQGTNKELNDPKTGTGLYGAVVSEDMIAIDGYECISSATQTVTIQIDETKNVIIFYYQENKVTINYVVDGPDGCGTVDLNDGDETGALTATSEEIFEMTGTAVGATAAASSNVYRFIGWYDEDGNKLSPDASYVPQQVDGKNVAATYYAKFEYNLTQLTITKNDCSVYESDDRFVFDVTNKDGTIKFSVTLAAGESVTIDGVTVGDEYTVTERTDWSWRYSASPVTVNKVILADADSNTFNFTNSLGTNYWLSGSSITPNSFK